METFCQINERLNFNLIVALFGVLNGPKYGL